MNNMPVKSDKRTSNLFIAGGYCLVAVIILFNYLGQSDTKDRLRSTLLPTSQTAAAAKSPDNFARQLEEERRLNQEMREIIKRLQGAVGGVAGNTGTVNVASARVPESVDDTSIPELKDQLIEAAFSKQSNPFIPGKNPFALPSIAKEQAGMSKPGEHFLLLKCDPRLPFVFTGANTRSEYYSNF
ncbi:MAG: hypothetical protein PHD82_08100 [Candidatus Riflebacteria bacterium]|nr:hypothetical protein [Candidatus Riflebacteria bacterium]